MRSSISSSEPLAPGRRWGATLVGAAVLATVGVGAVEVIWRGAGHGPTIVDSPDLWSYHRARATTAGSDAVVLLGSSRMQLDIDTERFRHRLPGVRLIHLAIDDSQPVAVLRDLAEDDRFRGTAIVDVTTWGLSRVAWNGQQGHVDHYRDLSTLNSRTNSRLGSLVRGRLVILNPQVELGTLARTGRPGAPFYLRTLPDRSRRADFELVDLEEHRTVRTRNLVAQPRAPDAEAWLAEALEVDRMADRIRERGGSVAFVRLPSSGTSWEYTERTYPKTRFWDRFAAESRSVVVHFRDEPAMASFECPDYSHLDQRDTAQFTDALIDALQVRGVLAGA